MTKVVDKTTITNSENSTKSMFGDVKDGTMIEPSTPATIEDLLPGHVVRLRTPQPGAVPIKSVRGNAKLLEFGSISFDTIPSFETIDGVEDMDLLSDGQTEETRQSFNDYSLMDCDVQNSDRADQDEADSMTGSHALLLNDGPGVVVVETGTEEEAYLVKPGAFGEVTMPCTVFFVEGNNTTITIEFAAAAPPGTFLN